MAPAGERFEFWRATFPELDLIPASRRQAENFTGNAVACIGQDGNRFVSVMTQAVSVRSQPDADDYVTLGGMMAGAAIERTGADENAFRADDRLILIDTVRGPKVESFGHHKTYLMLPRQQVMEALGGDAVMRRQPVLRLPDTAAARILWSHLRAIAINAPDLDTHGAASVMQAASLMAMAVLRQSRSEYAQSTSAWRDAELVLSTRQLMEGRVENASLKAEGIAAMLGCSRTRLFAAFQAQEQSLGDYLIEVRMTHARTLLTDPSQSIDHIARITGYADASSFGKAFRRLHGVSPGDWRIAVTAREVKVSRAG